MFGTGKQKARIEELENDLRKLRADFKALEFEWSNVYDKMRHLMGRIAKRADVVESASNVATPGAESTNDGTSVLSTLSPRAQKIQQQILDQRARRASGLLHG